MTSDFHMGKNLPIFLHIHWKQKVINLTTLSSRVALQVVMMTTYGATSDEKVVKLTIFCFQCRTLSWNTLASNKGVIISKAISVLLINFG